MLVLTSYFEEVFLRWLRFSLPEEQRKASHNFAQWNSSKRECYSSTLFHSQVKGQVHKGWVSWGKHLPFFWGVPFTFTASWLYHCPSFLSYLTGSVEGVCGVIVSKSINLMSWDTKINGLHVTLLYIVQAMLNIQKSKSQ